MQPDYTSQLEQIVTALNRPSIPTWLIAIVSAFLGFLASVLSQIFQHCYSEHRARSKMRMIIYSELGSNYSHLVHFHEVKTSLSGQEDIEWRKKRLKEDCLKFEGEKYTEDNKDVFIQLRERPTIILLYEVTRDVIGPEEEEYGFLATSGLAIEIIEDSVRLNHLPEKFVKRYMNGPDIAAIDAANKRRLALGQAHPRGWKADGTQ